MDDIRALDIGIDHLVVLGVLLEERNVTRAAKRLSLTQPAVSGMLRRLREVFEDPLFVRTQRGVLPTPRALALAGPVRQLLADVEALVSPVRFDPAAARMTLAIAATDYAQYVFLAPLVEALREQAPGLKLALLPLDSKNLAEQLARGQLDFALTVPEWAPPDLHARELFRERYMCAVRKGHPKIRRKPSLSAFCAMDHVIVSPDGGGFRGATDAALQALGKTRNVVLSLPSFLIVQRMLQTGDMIALVPERMLQERGDDVRLFAPPIDIPGFTMIAVWHARTHRSAAHVWLREQMVAVARNRLSKTALR